MPHRYDDGEIETYVNKKFITVTRAKSRSRSRSTSDDSRSKKKRRDRSRSSSSSRSRSPKRGRKLREGDAGDLRRSARRQSAGAARFLHARGRRQRRPVRLAQLRPRIRRRARRRVRARVPCVNYISHCITTHKSPSNRSAQRRSSVVQSCHHTPASSVAPPVGRPHGAHVSRRPRAPRRAATTPAALPQRSHPVFRQRCQSTSYRAHCQRASRPAPSQTSGRRRGPLVRPVHRGRSAPGPAGGGTSTRDTPASFRR